MTNNRPAMLPSGHIKTLCSVADADLAQAAKPWPASSFHAWTIRYQLHENACPTPHFALTSKKIYLGRDDSIMEEKGEGRISLQDLIDFLTGACSEEMAMRWQRQLELPESPESHLIGEIQQLPAHAFRRSVLDATSHTFEELLAKAELPNKTAAPTGPQSAGKSLPKNWRSKVSYPSPGNQQER